MRFPAGGCGKAGDQALHRRARSDLASLLPAYSVGQHKQPAMRARLLGRRGNHITEIVLVLLARSAAIGELREFHIQHRTWRLGDWKTFSGHVSLSVASQPAAPPCGSLTTRAWNLAWEISHL